MLFFCITSNPDTSNSHCKFFTFHSSGNKVLIVIGGDSYYRDQDEEQRCVISRWAKRKVASQFREEYLDGRESFIFSWDKTHRPIHEEALRHYFDPNKRGYKFEYTPPKSLPEPEEPEVTFPKPLPKPTEPEVTLPAKDQRQKVSLAPFPPCGLLESENVLCK